MKLTKEEIQALATVLTSEANNKLREAKDKIATSEEVRERSLEDLRKFRSMSMAVKEEWNSGADTFAQIHTNNLWSKLPSLKRRELIEAEITIAMRDCETIEQIKNSVMAFEADGLAFLENLEKEVNTTPRS